MSEAERRLQEVEDVFAALAQASRRQILMTIWFRGGVMTAGDIAKRFSHAWPTISRHLSVLEEAGLVIHEKEGRIRHYRVNLPKLEIIKDWLSWFDKKQMNQQTKKKGVSNDRIA